MSRGQLSRGPILVLLVLSLLWGGNMVAIKVSVQGVAPLFAAGLRSLVAGTCVYLWMRVRGVPAFPGRAVLLHGLAVGVMFGAEFGFIYLGLKHTLASRSAILLYTHPFFVAIGAHLLLEGDRLHARKAFGLVLAFAGVATLFARSWGPMSLQTLPGDLSILLGAALWGATTLYIKRFLTGRARPVQTLFYQLAFSAPVLLAWSALMEDRVWGSVTSAVAVSLLYQCFVVAFLSYIAWFELIERYSVSLLAAFTFFTPVFGVFLSAAALPGETLQPALLASLVLVCAGMILVNRPPRQPAGVGHGRDSAGPGLVAAAPGTPPT
ncbi:MAG: DMT family transporter [Deltaproteobacteria bacterium]|nr:DMT family transporter [Deltaproteobacteria bacterium]